MNKKQPLYDWLVQTLKNQIDSEYQSHQKMPSERELAKFYHVSRTTVRSALSQLDVEGYIYKEHGKGTFVSEEKDRMANLTKMFSFTDQMAAMNKVPKTKLLAFKIVKAEEELAQQMHLEIGERVIQIRRLRLADDEPMLVEVTWLPYSHFEGLTAELIERIPLYTIFSQMFHEHITVAKEEFFVGIIDKTSAKLLEIADKSPVFELRRKTYNQHNQLIELTHSIARGDKFRYQIYHKRAVTKEKGE